MLSVLFEDIDIVPNEHRTELKALSEVNIEDTDVNHRVNVNPHLIGMPDIGP